VWIGPPDRAHEAPKAFRVTECEHRQQVLQIITAAEARGQQRLSEMNHQVLDNLDTVKLV
jgi:hypothetical protein